MSTNDSTHIILYNRAFYPPQKLWSQLTQNISEVDYKRGHNISQTLQQEVEFSLHPLNVTLALWLTLAFDTLANVM